MKRHLATRFAFALLTVAMSLPQALRAGDKAGPVREAVRQEFQLAPFYAKTIVVGDLPIVGSTNVSAVALRDAFADAKKPGCVRTPTRLQIPLNTGPRVCRTGSTTTAGTIRYAAALDPVRVFEAPDSTTKRLPLTRE